MGFTINVTNENEVMDVEKEDNLLTICDDHPSSILFGCRDGICGTCLIDVKAGMENISAMADEEKDVVESMADDVPNARLACQCKVKGDITVEYIGG